MHKFVEKNHVVMGFPPAASPAGTEDFVSLKTFDKLVIILQQDNATSVTGATVTLLQSTVVAGTDEKALAFSFHYANTDTGASDVLVKTAVTANTFDTDTTANKNSLYIIEVDASDLDQVNDFDCVRVDVVSNANCVLAGLYVMGRLRYAGGLPRVSAITD